MKRFLTVTLVILLTAVMLFSCENNEGPAGSIVDSINAVLKTSADRAKERVCISQGAVCTLSRTSDEGKCVPSLLTDGVFCDAYSNTDWFEISKREDLTIDMDLGSVKTNIADIEIGIFRSYGNAVGLPESVTFSVSENGSDYTMVGCAYRSSDAQNNRKTVFSVKLQGTVDARYIRLFCSSPEKNWMFIDEISVYSYDGEVKTVPQNTELLKIPEHTSAQTGVSDYYDAYVAPVINGEELWASSEPDYNKKINLVAGASYQIKQAASMEKVYATETYNTKASAKTLTNGVLAVNPTYSDGGWTHFTRGEGREIIFDLTKTSAVSGFSIGFLNEEATKVLFPSGFTISASENGTDWKIIHSQYFINDGDASIARVNVDFDKIYKARLINISFTISSHVYCDEFELFGTKKIPAEAVSIADVQAHSTMYPNEYPKTDVLGAENILLSYFCRSQSGAGMITVEQYLPYVGYYNKEGVLTDTFYDGYLYLPYTAYPTSSLQNWQYYLDAEFTQDRNLSALSQAVKQVNDELGNKDAKVKVYFSILHPNESYENFGDIDSDGENDSLALLDNRKKAVKWLIDEQITRYTASGFDNLELEGFYWFWESSDYAKDAEIITYTAEYVHSLGYKLFWIPYNRAPGYSSWQSMGFDLASMQPNYMFHEGLTVNTVYEIAKASKLLGMAVELEMNDGASITDANRFKEYLMCGVQTGYMNTTKLYYQGGVPGCLYEYWKSTDEYFNSVYHETYAFAKGTLKVEDVLREYSIKASGETEYTGSGNIEGKITLNTNLDITMTTSMSPKYGGIKMNRDGSFVYIPFEGFAGTDTFAVCASNDYGSSGDITITVNITAE